MLADAASKGRLAENEEGHIGTEFEPELHQLAARQPEIPQPIESEQHRACIGTAAAEAAPHRQTLVDADRHPVAHAAMTLEQARGADGEIVVGRDRAGPRVRTIAPSSLAVSEIESPRAISTNSDSSV